MDPLSLVSTIGSLTVLTVKVAKDIHNVIAKYNNVPSAWTNIQTECSILAAGFRQVETWLKKNESQMRHNAEGVSDLKVCLEDFADTLHGLNAEVEKLLRSNLSSKFKIGTKSRISLLWNEDILKEHFETVRNQSHGLHFLISALQLPLAISNQQIHQVARAASIRRTRGSDNASIMSRETSLEDVLASTPAYQRAGLQVRPQTESFGQHQHQHQQHLLAALSQGMTLLVIVGHITEQNDFLSLIPGDFVKILRKTTTSLWYGEANGRTGHFPVDCCDLSSPLIGGSKAAVDASPVNVETILESDVDISQHGHDTKSLETFNEFVIAAKDNNYTAQTFVLRCKILKGSDCLTIKDREGWTILHYTAYHISNNYVIQQVLELGASVHAKTDNGMTPLSLAASKNNLNAIDELLKHGAEIQTALSNGNSDLHDQIRLDHVEIAERFINAGVFVDTKDSSMSTSLHLASELGRVDAARMLLMKGANPNARNRRGESPLFVAAWHGRSGFVELLKKKKADIYLCDKNGMSPLHAAALRGHKEACGELTYHNWYNEARLLQKDNEGRTSLHCAVKGKIVKEFLKYTAVSSVSSVLDGGDLTGRTPLHYAARLGYESIGVELICTGAQIKALDSAGWTPLHFAARHGHEYFAHMLIERGGMEIPKPKDSSVTKWSGLYPASAGIIWFFVSGQLQIPIGLYVILVLCTICLVIMLKFRSVTKVSSPPTPLHIAVLNGHGTLARLLIENGALPEVPEEDKASLAALCYDTQESTEGKS